MNNIENKIKQVSKYIKNKDIVLDIKLINYDCEINVLISSIL